MTSGVGADCQTAGVLRHDTQFPIASDFQLASLIKDELPKNPAAFTVVVKQWLSEMSVELLPQGKLHLSALNTNVLNNNSI